jgi:hypothetical protein
LNEPFVSSTGVVVLDVVVVVEVRETERCFDAGLVVVVAVLVVFFDMNLSFLK